MKRRKGFTLLELVIALMIISIISGGLFLTFRQSPRQHLENASLQLQADIRYAQRRAIIEGRRVDVFISVIGNYYRVRLLDGPSGIEIIRTVHTQNGVHIMQSNVERIIYYPRGTPSGVSPGTIELRNGRYRQHLTILPSGGRVRIGDIH